MFETKENSRLNIYGSYLNLIVTFVVSFAIFYLFIANEETLYQLFKNYSVFRTEVFFELITVVVLFLIFNTSYYSLVSYHRSRMLVFSIVFLTTGCMELLYIVNKFNLVDSQQLMYQVELQYSTFGRLILAVGFLIASLIPIDQKLRNSNSFLPKVVPIAGLVFFLALNRMMKPYFGSVSALDHYRVIHMIAEYFIAVAMLLTIVFYMRSYAHVRNQYIIQLCSGALIVLFGQAFKVVYGSVNELNHMMYSIYQAVGFMLIFIAVFRYNIGIPIVQLMNAEKQIKLYAENLEKIIEKRTTEIRSVNARFIKEMDYARSIQQSLLPLKRLNFKNTVFISEFFPCERLSGDFYDIYRIDDENIGMYVLDVSGHGISAALMTMFCNNYIKSSERLIKRYRGLKPHRNLRHFYEEFNKMNFPEEMHMVIFFASYNLETKALTYSSGGMNCYPIVVRKEGAVEYLDKSQGFPICKFSQFYTPEYTSVRIQLYEGDRVIFYTDGLIDKNKNMVLDEEELIQIAVDSKDESIKMLNNRIVNQITPVVDDLDDDITYFIMEVSS